MNKAVLIFSGYNQRAVISFIRTLESCNVKYFIFARDINDTILSSVYKKKVVEVRKNKKLEVEEIINQVSLLKKDLLIDEFLILPSSEYLNRFLLNNREELESNGCLIPLVDKSLYVKISDKETFAKLCINNQIICPQEHLKLDADLLPIVAKPKKFLSKDGKTLAPIILAIGDDYKSFCDKEDENEYFYQEYIEGECYYLLCYFDKHGNVNTYSQKNLIQQADGKSMIFAKSSCFHLTDEASKYIIMLSKLLFRGLIMIEVKKKDDRYYMIEANPRLWGPSQMLLDSGNNFFELLLKDFGFISKEVQLNPQSSNNYYLWFGGLIDNFKNKKQVKYYRGSENFYRNLEKYLTFDVYKKEDTIEIFESELE